MDKNVSKGDINKIEDFINIYEELTKVLIYDEDYAEEARMEDQLDNLSAYEIKMKDSQRTKMHKKGDSKIFAMGLSEELTSLEIENYLMLVQKGNSTQWVNLYKDNEQWLVANISDEIIYKNYELKISNKQNEFDQEYAKVPIEEFLLFNAKCYVLEKIEDNGKSLNNLSKIYYEDWEKYMSGERKEETTIRENIFNRIFASFKNSIKEIISSLQEKGFFVVSKEETLAIGDGEERKEEVVPKVVVDEQSVIEKLENRSREEDKSKSREIE